MSLLSRFSGLAVKHYLAILSPALISWIAFLEAE